MCSLTSAAPYSSLLSFGTAARSANRARSARGDFAMQSVAPMEQRREALTEREALEVILGGMHLCAV